MTLTASSVSYVQGFRFLVAVDGFKSKSFVGLTEVEAENSSSKRCTAKLSRGLAVGDYDMAGWAWEKDPRQLIVSLMDRDGTVVQRVEIKDARPTGYRLGRWSNDSKEVIIEEVSFEYDAAWASVEVVGSRAENAA